MVILLLKNLWGRHGLIGFEADLGAVCFWVFEG